jgi:hypothetical protein
MADPKSQLVAAIRSFVHMDNLAETHARQATNAREARARHETEAIRLLREMGMTTSTIQVSGGVSLAVAHQRAPGSLSWGYLEREVPAWAAQSGVSAAQSAGLLQWLRDHREIKESEYLKKTVAKSVAGTPTPGKPV